MVRAIMYEELDELDTNRDTYVTNKDIVTSDSFQAWLGLCDRSGNQRLTDCEMWDCALRIENAGGKNIVIQIILS
eukprot:UN13121